MAKNTEQYVIHCGTSRCQRITIEGFDKKPGRAIAPAAAKFPAGKHLDEFPLLDWQTTLGTQTNMHADGVIASRAHEAVGQPLGMMAPVRSTDHTLKQSTAGRRE